jgi:hypothetical protein
MSEENKPQHGEETKVIELLEETAILEELIDLEQWAKAGKKPQRAKRYRIRIDKEYKEVTVHSMTGMEILALVGKTPDKYLLSQKLHGGVVEPIKPDQIVKFHHHAIERFQTLALDPTEG